MTSFDSIQGVLFDLDGTLIDSQAAILASFRHSTKTVLGQTVPDKELMEKVGQPLATQMWSFTSDPVVHEKLLSTYRAHNKSVHDQLVHAFGGVEASLRELQQCGFALGVVTSKMHKLAQRGIDISGLTPYLSFVVAPDDFPLHKPDPGPVLYGCELARLDPARCCYVGDSPYDMQAGKAAGCATVAVTWGMFSEACLRAEEPDAVINTMDELLDLVGRA